MNIGVWNPRVGHAEAGGTETFLREMVSRLACDHDVTVYTRCDGPTPDALRPARVEYVGGLRKEDPGIGSVCRWTPVLPAEIESATMVAAARARGLFDDMGHDVLTTHYYLDNLLVSRRASCPTVFRFAGIKQPSPRWRAMLRFDDADAYLSNSKATARRLYEWFGLDTADTIYAGVDTDAFRPDRAPRTDGGRPRILYAGRLDEGKGLYDLVDALSRLPVDAELRLVGDGVLRQRLAQYARDAGVADRVTIAGRVPHDEMPAEYAAADVVALPSYHEGFPVVVIEALASGTPVVASDIDAIRETITDGETGWLVEPGDVDALAARLADALTQGDQSAAMRARARDVARRYEWDAQAASFERALAAVAREAEA